MKNIDLTYFTNPVIYIVFASAMLILSIVINGLLLKFSVNLGTKNEQEQVRWAPTSKPALGGISFYILFLFSIVFYAIFFGNSKLLLNTKFLGCFTATSLGFMMGLADDAYNTKPFLKFLVQFICGIILVLTGNSISVFSYEWLNYLVTVFWVVGMMNSINMLDNMDGITASISIIVCIAACMIILTNQDYYNLYFIILIGTIAGISGFLYFNWNPSRMYMGDSGSQFLGAFLACIGAEFFWNGPDNFGENIPSKQIIIAILIFIVPIADTTTVSINRIMRRQSPFVGGRDHTTHHLSYMGLSDRQVAFVLILLSLFTMTISVLVINYIPNWGIAHTIGFGALFLLIVSGLYSTTKISKPKPKT
jgi:UDP-GlcNAc:undecaprenyl-phosphate GlcNAc-1-phosphate transferase